MPMRNSYREWVFPEIHNIPGDFQAAVGGSSLVAQSLYRRGIQDIHSANGFLNPDHYQPAPPPELPGLQEAVNRLNAAIKNNDRILVWGDFDVDGQTSTALLVTCLAGIGADVTHYIPNRATESHGISAESLAARIEDLAPSVLLTCDTGIDAFGAIEYAATRGIDVIVTDHHQLPDRLPEALAIVNPNLLPPTHPLYDLPGVGVAYKLIEELYNQRDRDHTTVLDLVALGIVADVAVQRLDNRYLLQKGLPLLKNTTRAGLHQLYKIAGINAQEINEETIGYMIGPRLNALGRLDDANTCVEFFTTNDSSRAATLAANLEHLNMQRQELTEQIFQDALQMIHAYPELDDDYPVLVLEGPPQWHPGVIGIVASRLVERFDKPVIMLSQDGDLARGSARSIPGVPIASLISLTKPLLLSHGGHPMAAGVSLPLENTAPFRAELKKQFQQVVGISPDPQPIEIDADLPFNMISLDLIREMNRLSPFGSGNPKPLYATRGVRIIEDAIIGKRQNHRKLTLEDSSGKKQQLLWWNSVDIDLPSAQLDVAYSLDISSFRDQLQTQATLVHFRESEESPVYLPTTQTDISIHDYRDCTNSLKILNDLNLDSSTTIWAELDLPEAIKTTGRQGLKEANSLVVWTSPPSQSTLTKSIVDTSPHVIYLFAEEPNIHSVSLFITKLLGLIKKAASQDSRPYDPDLFAQAIAVTPALIEAGLEWIHQHGDLDLSEFKVSNNINEGEGKNLDGFEKADSRLKALLKELASYRIYYKNARLENLL